MRKIQFIILVSALFLVNFQHIFAQNKAVFLSHSTTWADSIMTTLSEKERIAQLFMVAAYSNKGEDHKQQITNLVQQYKIFCSSLNDYLITWQPTGKFHE